MTVATVRVVTAMTVTDRAGGDRPSSDVRDGGDCHDNDDRDGSKLQAF